MSTYASHVSSRQNPQTQPIPESTQVQNSAGGFSWKVDCWTRLQRFLVLGNEGGSYYATERALTREASAAIAECINQDTVRTIKIIDEISYNGRAPKNEPAVFALAQVAAQAPVTFRPEIKAAFLRVVRTGTDLFIFAECLKHLRKGGLAGRGMRNLIASWYEEKSPPGLAYQVAKYQQRNGWAQRDLIRLTRPKPPTNSHAEVLRWAIGKHEGEIADGSLETLVGMERLKGAADPAYVAQIIIDKRLPRECVGTEHLNHPVVWEALLENMPMTAMIRNLGKMSAIGLIKPMSNATRTVCSSLRDREVLRSARVHPLAIMLAMSVYKTGRGVKGSLTWNPVPQVLDALQDAFHLAFETVEPTRKRWLLGLDVSGSMASSRVTGTHLSCRSAAACLAMMTAKVEPDYAICAFGSEFAPLDISPACRLDDVIRKTDNLPFMMTDCSIPMLYALENKIPVDVFAVYTDNETYAGRMHPKQALDRYRQKTGIGAKLIVMAMVANNFTIADPNDSGMLDLIGLDASVPAVMADFAIS